MVLKGDVDKLFRTLKKKYGHSASIRNICEMDDVRQIRSFYEKFDKDELKHLYVKMRKEQAGIGMIPLVASSLSFVGFIFGDNLRGWVKNYDPYGWLIFIFVYTVLIVFALFVHYRQKAWSTFHLTIIEDLLEE